MASKKTKKQRRNAYYLKKWRTKAELNQTDVAEELKTDQSTVSRAENGKTPFDIEYLEKLAKLYKREVWELLERDPDQPNPRWEVHDLLKDASPEEVERVKAYAAGLLKSAR